MVLRFPRCVNTAERHARIKSAARERWGMCEGPVIRRLVRCRRTGAARRSFRSATAVGSLRQPRGAVPTGPCRRVRRSAGRTRAASASSSACTATVRMPVSAAARRIRTAVSPRPVTSTAADPMEPSGERAGEIGRKIGRKNRRRHAHRHWRQRPPARNRRRAAPSRTEEHLTGPRARRSRARRARRPDAAAHRLGEPPGSGPVPHWAERMPAEPALTTGAGTVTHGEPGAHAARPTGRATATARASRTRPAP